MCTYCTSNAITIQAIELWATNGLPYTSLTILARPTAETYPNTYVFVFNNAVHVNGAMRDVKVDVHYQGNNITPGKPRLAIGGLWMTGIFGAMKPQQHGGDLLQQLLAELPSNAPSIVTGTYGTNQPMPGGLISELEHHQNKVRTTGTFRHGF